MQYFPNCWSSDAITRIFVFGVTIIMLFSQEVFGGDFWALIRDSVCLVGGGLANSFLFVLMTGSK